MFYSNLASSVNDVGNNSLINQVSTDWSVDVYNCIGLWPSMFNTVVK